MAPKNAKAGGGTSELFLDLAKPYASTIVMRIVSQDGKRDGTNGQYDVVTAHVLVVDGPKAYEFHKAVQITGKGITGVLVNEPVGEDIVATLQHMPASGARQAYAAAQPASEEKFAEVAALFEQGDPFAHYLGDQAATPVGAQTPATTSSAKKPPWAK